MNIFMLDSNPVQAARWMVDKHVVKMILESAQLLSTAHRLLDGKESQASINGRKRKLWSLFDERETQMYKATHVNHPCAIWCRESVENYSWLVEHFFALLDEYTYRYNKKHKCSDMGFILQSPPLNLKEWNITPAPSCMAKEYIVSDNVIENYRNYYKVGKKHIHSWKNRETPEWIMNNEI